MSKIIIVKGCQDCPCTGIHGCGYDCITCDAKYPHVKSIDRSKMEKDPQYKRDDCPLEDYEKHLAEYLSNVQNKQI